MSTHDEPAATGPEARDRVRDAGSRLLREDGLLLAGHSESFLHATDLFRSLGRTAYERADRTPGVLPRAR